MAARLAKMKCFNCGKKGHPAKACSHKLKKLKEGGEVEGNEPPLAGMILDTFCSTMRTRRLPKIYEICIDNGSQANIVDPRLLRELKTTCNTYRSMNGQAETSRAGRLEGFFDCMACEDCPTSILSLADVEDIYPVTYMQGESITVHMDHRDVVFARRDKLYIADFSDWVVDNDNRVEEMYTGLNLMTAAERERASIICTRIVARE